MPTKSWKNHLKKLHTYGSWEVFFSAAPAAQNSPELHFRFINSFIQSSLLRSLVVIVAWQSCLSLFDQVCLMVPSSNFVTGRVCIKLQLCAVVAVVHLKYCRLRCKRQRKLTVQIWQDISLLHTLSIYYDQVFTYTIVRQLTLLQTFYNPPSFSIYFF